MTTKIKSRETEDQKKKKTEDKGKEFKEKWHMGCRVTY
jgi:hypothetical protein